MRALSWVRRSLLASDYVPEQLRASGVGWYNTIVGLSTLVASLVAGWLWDQVGHATVFLFGAASLELAASLYWGWFRRI
jgi:MFS family permease